MRRLLIILLGLSLCVPLVLASATNSVFPPLTTQTLYGECLNDGVFVASNSNIVVYSPNTSVIINATMTPFATGKFNYTITTPQEEGTYAMCVTCDATGVSDCGSFQVKDINEEVSRLAGFAILVFLGIGILLAILGKYLDNLSFYVASGAWFLATSVYGGFTIFTGLEQTATIFLLLMGLAMIYQAYDTATANAKDG